MRMQFDEGIRQVRRGTWRIALIAGAVAAAPTMAAAEDAAPIVEKLEHGQVDWSARKVLATGSGAPNLKLDNVAQVRLAAERAAKLDAYRKIIETLKGVRITATELGSAKLSRIEVRAQVQGIVQGCKRVDTRYYSDGGVDVVLDCPLDGGLGAALAPAGKRVEVPTEGDKTFTGLVVDATGLQAKPTLSPNVVNDLGTPVYVQGMVKSGALRTRGAVGYTRSVEEAKKDARVGKNPIVVRAAELGETAGELKLAEGEAKKLDGKNLSFLAEGRVVIATDAL